VLSKIRSHLVNQATAAASVGSVRSLQILSGSETDLYSELKDLIPEQQVSFYLCSLDVSY